MKLNREQELKAWTDVSRKVRQLPQALVWGLRAAVLGLGLIWLGGALYLHSVVKEDERELLKIQQRAQQREERLRREAAYRQSLQQQNPQNQVQNAVDARR